jgi:hypothetical protein
MKHSLPSFSTEEGMKSDESDLHSENANPSIDESREPDSKLTVERDSQPEKQDEPSRSTEEAMQIDERKVPSNADAPINLTFDALAKITLETVSQPEKQPSANSMTSPPITTSLPLPKYRFIELPAKSKTKSPITLK